MQTNATFADAATEWLRYVEHDRQRKPSTLAGYRAIVRSQLLPAFGELPLESITTPMIERWLASLGRSASTRRLALDLEVFSPEEVWALVRAAESEQDAAIYLPAAFTGLRMGELLALRMARRRPRRLGSRPSRRQLRS